MEFLSTCTHAHKKTKKKQKKFLLPVLNYSCIDFVGFFKRGECNGRRLRNELERLEKLKSSSSYFWNRWKVDAVNWFEPAKLRLPFATNYSHQSHT